MATRIGAALMALFLLICLVLVGQKAIIAVGTGDPLAIVIGVGLFLLVAVGVWSLLREVLFGIRAERLGARLDALGELPAEEIPVSPSGRPDRDSVDELFPAYRAQVEENPTSWTAWYRLGLVYDGAGDRKRARAAIRESIRLSRTA